MPYYYSRKRYSTDYDDTNSLQKTVMVDLKDIYDVLLSRNSNLKLCWTKKNGLGCVFTDIPEEQLGDRIKNNVHCNRDLLGKGETPLYSEIWDRCDYVIVSEGTPGNSIEYQIGNLAILEINIKKFHKVMETKDPLQSVIHLFLQPPPKDDLDMLLEKLLRQAKDDEVIKIVKKLESLFYRFRIQDNEDFKIIVRIVTHLLQNLKIDKADDLKKIPDLSKITESIIQSNPTFFTNQLTVFKSQLEEFERRIDDDEKEKRLQDLIQLNPWILDFKYFEYPPPVPNKEVDFGNGKIGKIDLFFCKKRFNTDYITIVEFKKSDVKPAGTSYRGEHIPVILSPVVKALSQIIHYIEHNRGKPYTKVEGVLIIGKKDDESDEFISTFSSYLHGIDIITYDQLLDTASGIVTALQGKTNDVVGPTE